MFENIINFFKNLGKKEKKESSSAAKERLHLVLMQDRANVSADFLELMRQEIIEVIKKYIDIDEKAIDVKLTNKTNEDGTVGAPALYANIPIITIKNDARKINVQKTNNEQPKDQEKKIDKNNQNKETEKKDEKNKSKQDLEKENEKSQQESQKEEKPVNENEEKQEGQVKQEPQVEQIDEKEQSEIVIEDTKPEQIATEIQEETANEDQNSEEKSNQNEKTEETSNKEA